MSSELTQADIDALQAVEHGADVYDYALAKRLRHIERANPGLVTITEPQMYRGDGTDRMPYFGAICTAAGRAAIARATGQEG